jgi:hypothetical protein
MQKWDMTQLVVGVVVVVLGQLGFMSIAAASCGAAYCAVNTDLDAQGISGDPGFRLGLRYEYINQETLRSGRERVAPTGEPGTHDELHTYNRNLLASLDYVFTGGWGVSAQLPAVSRRHAHIHNDPVNGPELETWDFTSVGDARIVARYQPSNAPFSAPGVKGIRFGFKLPTGRIDETNADGAVAERSLQPGSGSTDMLLGVYATRGFIGNALSIFSEALWRHAVATRDSYRPGDQVSLDLGLNYPVSTKMSAVVQANMLFKSHDKGANAEPEDSGGRFLHLSPGLTYALTKTLGAYAFFQQPLYQYVHGTQLTADWAAVAGATYRF